VLCECDFLFLEKGKENQKYTFSSFLMN